MGVLGIRRSAVRGLVRLVWSLRGSTAATSLLIAVLASACSRTALLDLAASSAESPPDGAGGSDAGPMRDAPAEPSTDAEEEDDGYGADGGDAFDAGTDEAIDGASTDGTVDAVALDPFSVCVLNCAPWDDYAGYATVLATTQECACAGLCAPECMTDAGYYGHACIELDRFVPDRCVTCIVQSVVLGACEVPGNSKPAQSYLSCIEACGVPPPDVPGPYGSKCPADAGGLVVSPEPMCCASVAPAADSPCSPLTAVCVYGSVACFCKADSGGSRWHCNGYGDAGTDP